MRRHPRSAIAAVAVAATLLAACGGGEAADNGENVATDSTATDSTQAADDSGESISLSFQTLAWQEQSVEANHAIVDAWNEENPNIQVEYVQGDWGSVHDQLLTSFEGGTPPDVIHYEASAIQVFAEGGYLADLSGMLDQDFTSGISDDLWATVEYEDAGTIGVPFLVESRLPLANRTMLEDAGVRIPTNDDPWTWDEFQDAAMQLTNDDTYGVAFPLSSPTNAMMTLSAGTGGTWVSDLDADPTINVGDAELEVPERIHSMLYEDKSADPSTISTSTTDALPGFFADKYAMVFGAIWLRQQMVELAPEGFEWMTIPPIEGSDGAKQAVSPQILSVAAQSEHPKEAAQFIQYFLGAQNMAELALGDWLTPTSDGALSILQEQTDGERGWDVAVASADSLTAMPWQQVAGMQEWQDRVATPAFQRYFANEVSVDELADELEDGGSRLGR